MVNTQIFITIRRTATTRVDKENAVKGFLENVQLVSFCSTTTKNKFPM